MRYLPLFLLVFQTACLDWAQDTFGEKGEASQPDAVEVLSEGFLVAQWPQGTTFAGRTYYHYQPTYAPRWGATAAVLDPWGDRATSFVQRTQPPPLMTTGSMSGDDFLSARLFVTTLNEEHDQHERYSHNVAGASGWLTLLDDDAAGVEYAYPLMPLGDPDPLYPEDAFGVQFAPASYDVGPLADGPRFAHWWCPHEQQGMEPTDCEPFSEAWLDRDLFRCYRWLGAGDEPEDVDCPKDWYPAFGLTAAPEMAESE